MQNFMVVNLILVCLTYLLAFVSYFSFCERDSKTRYVYFPGITLGIIKTAASLCPGMKQDGIQNTHQLIAV